MGIWLSVQGDNGESVVAAEGAAVPSARRALLLLNRKARNGGSSIDRAREVLQEAGLSLTELDCAGAAAMRGAITERQSELDLVIVGGGDGTLNCAASTVMKTGLPLGILPLGTANDLARTLGIQPDPVVAASVIAAGHMRSIDLGEVNGNLFFNVASIGFSADLARELTREAKARWGTLGYGLAGLKLLARARPFMAFIEHDGTVERVKTFQISVGNGRHYGGGMTVDATAEPDDGHFHVYSLELDHWWRMVALVPWLKKGTHGTWRDVRAFTTAAVTIRTRRARSVNTDGELSTATPAVFRIIPKAVRVFAPAPLQSESTPS